MSVAGAAPTLAATVGAPAETRALPVHVAEIKAFVSTMAVARTVGESCPGASIHEGYREDMRGAISAHQDTLQAFRGRPISSANGRRLA